MVFFQEITYKEQKMERMSRISMTEKVNEHTEFHYLLTEIQLRTLVLLELNIFPKKYSTKSKTNE